MALYKTTEEGNIPMTPEEEAQVKADWARAEELAKQPKPKTDAERIADLELRVRVLERASIDGKK